MKTVLVVDDSALVRKQLRGLIEELGFEVDIARNGQEAVDKVAQENYAVITMDVNMPVMDGLTAVKEIMKINPTPILMVSSLTSDDAPTTMEALENGAIDYVAKPGTFNVGLADTGDDLIQKIKSLSRVNRRRLLQMLEQKEARKREHKTHQPRSLPQRSSRDIKKVLLIGASTGGPGLIEDICAILPEGFDMPVCIVQHMPEKFTEAFAKRLEKVANLPVVESKANEELIPGVIYIAKGGTHLHFAKKVSGKVVLRHETDKNGRFFQPSVDEMMLSAVQVFDAKNLIGVLLTGIGDDGAEGMVAIKKGGGFTIAESERTATVYGMPKEAYDRGGVSEQLDFPDILKRLQVLK